VPWSESNIKDFISDSDKSVSLDLFPAQSELPCDISMCEQNFVQAFPQEWHGSFDLVHQRFVISLFQEKNINIVLDKSLLCLKPGGWVQSCQPDFGTPVSEPRDETSSFQMIHKQTGHVMADNIAATN
jgi:hypothetical protein